MLTEKKKKNHGKDSKKIKSIDSYKTLREIENDIKLSPQNAKIKRNLKRFQREYKDFDYFIQ